MSGECRRFLGKRLDRRKIQSRSLHGSSGNGHLKHGYIMAIGLEMTAKRAKRIEVPRSDKWKNAQLTLHG